MPKGNAKVPLNLMLSGEEALALDALAAATGRSRRALVAEAVGVSIEALPGTTRDAFERLKRALKETPRYAPKPGPAATDGPK